jgi:bacterioferritin-associated ferredoxin
MDACKEGAITFVRRQQVLTLSVDWCDVDQKRLEELCNKAHYRPDDTICLCTMTRAKEVAAAILKGAESPEEISMMTGVRTSCGMYCISPILRLLRGHGVDVSSPKGHNWYDAHVSLWDISDEVAEKYPRYCLKEDKQLLKEGVFDNLVSVLRKKGA